MRKHHNGVKSDLIQRVGCRTLLDVSCGRGGDIHKWHAAGVTFALGVDPNRKSVVEANTRAFQMGWRDKFLFASYELGARRLDDVVTDVVGIPFTFDGVSCMFALQHMFSSEAEVATLLDTVYGRLNPGGAFFGVVPDGDAILKAVCSKQDTGSASLSFAPCKQAVMRCPGAKIGFTFKDSTPYFDDVEGTSAEFLVFGSYLKRAAETRGFVCREWTPFPRAFPESALYSTFWFQKNN